MAYHTEVSPHNNDMAQKRSGYFLMQFCLGQKKVNSIFKNKSSHVGLSRPPEGEGDPHEVGPVVRVIFIYLCQYGMVPGARDAAGGHVVVAGVGVVSRRGPGPSP